MMAHYQVLQKELVQVVRFTADDYYESTDTNRVEQSIFDAYNKFVRAGITVAQIRSPIIDKDIFYVPTIDDFNRIEENLERLDLLKRFNKKTWYEGRIFDYEDANRYEMAAELLETLKQNITDEQNICGAFLCGGDTYGIY